jgi:hypothetical protein
MKAHGIEAPAEAVVSARRESAGRIDRDGYGGLLLFQKVATGNPDRKRNRNVRTGCMKRITSVTAVLAASMALFSLMGMAGCSWGHDDHYYGSDHHDDHPDVIQVDRQDDHQDAHQDDHQHSHQDDHKQDANESR